MVAVIKEGTCWEKKLPLSNGRVDRDTYGKALIKIPKIDGSLRDQISGDSDGEKKDQSALVLVISVLVGGSLLLNFILVAATCLVVCCSYKKTNFLRVAIILPLSLTLLLDEIGALQPQWLRSLG